MASEPKDDRDTPRLPRKPYVKPKLDAYGSIAEITRHIGNASPNVDPPPYAAFKFTTR